MSRIRRSLSDEGGVVIIFYALLMVVLLGIGALVLDLSQLRSDRRINKSVADMAVRAGLGVLSAGPWSGVCRASNYLLANSPEFHSYDTTSSQFFQLSQISGSLASLSTNPCLSPLVPPYTTLCLPNAIAGQNTWGKLTATAGGGRFTIEIQSGYSMPDNRFAAEDRIASADTGDPLMGSCDNLVVIITERRAALFGGVLGGGAKTTVIRSVGRISNVANGQYNPAVLLLDPHGCSVLNVSGNGTRVIAQPFADHPGIIQIDSADDQGGCASNQAVLNGQATSGGPSIVACNATTGVPSPGCNVATSNAPGRIGIYALNFVHPPGDYVTSAYPGTYGDVQAVRSTQSGRGPVDAIYRSSVQALDADAKAVVTGNGGLPPGCTTVAADSTCTGNGLTWLVLQQPDCDSYTTFFDAILHPGRSAMQNVYFHCDLSVGSVAPLTLTAANSFVVITGRLTVAAVAPAVTTTFAALDPRKVYVGGPYTGGSGSKVGLGVGNGGNFNIGNPSPGSACPASAGLQRYTSMVVGSGPFNMTSGGSTHLCQTFVFMANSYNHVPATNATGPCTCYGAGYSDYTGNISVASGSQVDWSAPNLITGRRPTATELGTITPFEDLAAWTEAGGSGTNSFNGGGGSNMVGVFFLPNSMPFSLAGNSGANLNVSAQFISQAMNVTGGAVINVVLNPYDSVPFVVYDLTLVR